jgi:hypothetical protein
MNITEIKVGSVFTIDETPSYPKLRTENGYIDMRDKIVVNNLERVKDYEVREMTLEEMCDYFDATEIEMKAWIEETKKEDR